MKVHLAVNSGFIQIFANIIKDIDINNEHQFIVYGEQMTGQIINESQLEKNFQKFNTILEAQINIEILVEKATTIYIHFLTNEIINILSNLDLKGKKIVWFLWGSDAFSLPEVYVKLKQFRTDYLRAILGKFKQIFTNNKSNQTKLLFLKKIDYVAHYSIDDFNLIKPLLESKAQFKYFTYGVFEYVVYKDVELKGNDILLGNSASKNNNHIYTINHILPKNIKQKIYCPLPYGADEIYTKQLIQAGKQKFGNNFLPLTELIETNDYCKNILTQTSIAIMPHNRSQAWGNIMQLLWQGSSVYMFKDNNLYKYLKEKGFQIFQLSKKSCKEFDTKKVNMEFNRKLLMHNFSLNNLLEDYKKILAF